MSERLQTPGGTPGNMSSYKRFMEGIVNKQGRDHKRSTDRDSVDFCRELVEYFYQRHGDVRDSWEVSEAEYNIGKGVDAGYLELDQVMPSRAYSIVQTNESMVLANRPKFFLQGFTAPDHEEVAPILEAALNNEWRQDFALVKQTRLCVRDCSKYGIGVMLTSFENAFEETEKDEAPKEVVFDPTLEAAAAETARRQSEQAAREPAPELEHTFEADSSVYRGRIVSRRISVWDLLIDPDCTSIDDAKWVGRRIIADFDTVLQDPSLENTEGLEPNCEVDLNGVHHHRLDEQRLNGVLPYDFLILYEIFIRNPDGSWTMKLFSPDHSSFLREVEMPYWIGCPYDILRWNDDGESIFPQNDVALSITEIVAERVLLTKVFDGYSSEQLDTYIFDRNMGITEEDLHVIHDPDNGKWIGVDTQNLQGRVQDGIFKLPKDAKSPEVINLLGLIERSMQISTGLGPNQVGQALKSGTTATEAAEVGSFARSRGAHKFSAVEEFIAGVAQNRIGLMAQFYSASDIRRLVGAEAAEIWAQVEWTKGDVQNGLQVVVEPGSTRQVTEESRINQLMTMLGMIMQNPTAAALFDVVAMYKELFRLMGFHDGSKFLLMNDGLAAGNLMAEAAVAQGNVGGQSGSAPALPGGSPAQQQAGADTLG